jgi:hypothetical protein
VKKRSVLALGAVLLIALAAVGAEVYHHRVIRQQLQLAYSSVRTVLDYADTSSMPDADLIARNRLDELQTQSMDASEADAAEKLRVYLGTIESLEGSLDIETTELRQGIAIEAMKKADAAMMQFK